MNPETFRAFCLSFKGATEDIKWDDHLCFSVGAKMFAITNLDGPLTASLKVTPEEFEELTARPEITPSSHLARYHWLNIAQADALTVAEWEKLVTQSYELVKVKLPKKLRAQIEST